MRPFLQKLVSIPVSVATRLEKVFRPSARPRSGDVKSILVLESIVPLGGCVHMTPLFEIIKRAQPDTVVTVATWGVGAAVLRHSPFIDHLIVTPDPLKKYLGALRSLRKQLKQRGLKPDCCLTGAADQRSKLAIFAALACGGWRGGITLLPALYARPLSYDHGINMIANNLRLADLIGIHGQPPEPKVFFSTEDAAVARQLTDAARADGRPVLVVISRNSGGLPTAWHEDRWAETVRYAHDVLGYNILYSGIASDASALSALKEQAGGIGTSLAGVTSITQLAAVIALSDMVISIATGGLHVARSIGTPVLVLGLAWEKPLQWLVEGRPSMRILRGPDIEKAPPGYRLDDISVEWATTELAAMSQLFPPDRDAREARLQASLCDVDHLRG